MTGGEGGAGSRKKLVSRATLKGFMRGMHGHDGHRGRGSVRFFADFPVTWFLDDPLGVEIKFTRSLSESLNHSSPIILHGDFLFDNFLLLSI